MQINSVEMAGLNTSISTRGKCLSKGSRALSLLSLICRKEGRKESRAPGRSAANYREQMVPSSLPPCYKESPSQPEKGRKAAKM